MKHLIIIPIFIFLISVSCNNRHANEQQKETPKALEEKDSYESSFKRGYNGDLVENLYTELVEKTPELKELEIKVDKLLKSRNDSTDLFIKYNGKNQSYYNDAERHIDQIKDSLLRDKMKILIASSLEKYISKTLQHTDLLKIIDTNTLALNDLHSIIKITTTLAVMEKYQTDNLPTTKSLKGFLKQLDKTIGYADTISKK